MALQLGSMDREAQVDDPQAYLGRFHESAMPGNGCFRGECDAQWVPLGAVDGQPILDLQALLRELGFYPKGQLDGIYGYRTCSAVRLFQEHVRAVEGETGIGKPDGSVGPLTDAHLRRWRREGKTAPWRNGEKTAEYTAWLKLLRAIRDEAVATGGDQTLAAAAAHEGASDTLAPQAWRYEPEDIHLVGVRRREWVTTGQRANDDFFVLLVNGMAFKFAGSTDPNPSMARRPDEPYIVPGQHLYRFGWHKQSDTKRVYRAFKPLRHGPLVFRDVIDDNALTEEDVAAGAAANPSINIHWSGKGTSNWSAGCQVISGRAYLDERGEVVDCSAFASTGYVGLDRGTRGAYNVLLDLITIFADRIDATGDFQLRYTLLYERDLEIGPTSGAEAGDIVHSLIGDG